MAARNNAGLMKIEKLSQRSTERMHMTTVAVFNYMIGNTDWSVPGQHNIKLIKVLDINKPSHFRYHTILIIQGLSIQNMLYQQRA